MRNEINWQKINRVLVVRLRSIGDTVLSTPALLALRRHLPNAQIDILLEDWVAPVLDGLDAVDNVLTVSRDAKARVKLARRIRQTKYDVAFNLHGGTTATFLVRASGAKHRVGYKNYQYSFLYNHLLSSAADFWKKEQTHSAEQQLALLGFVGIPVGDKPRTYLAVTAEAVALLDAKLRQGEGETRRQGDKETNQSKIQNLKSKIEVVQNLKSKIGLLHPAAAFETKRWAADNFARVAEYLSEKGLQVVAVAARNERAVLDDLKKSSKVPISTFDDLTLPEITALAARADVFVGNDSGIAHIAAAVGTPGVVIFGSSNRDHWHPWTDAPFKVVFEELPCQPCAGRTCEEFGQPKCILSIKTESVIEAIERVLQ